jgi:flavin reductase (DIM6/NTAB) family NADH-FMN oxidoreductase RutF
MADSSAGAAAFDPALARDAFRVAMRQVASTVNVVTVLDEAGNRHGMTATAMCSVSFDPPSLLVCVNRSTSTYSMLGLHRGFCVNILAAEQEHVARAFATSGNHRERFKMGDWKEGWQGLPSLSGCRASIFCSIDAVVPTGTHVVIVGVVREVLNGGKGQPLIYLDGKFGLWGPDPVGHLTL